MKVVLYFTNGMNCIIFYENDTLFYGTPCMRMYVPIAKSSFSWDHSLQKLIKLAASYS